MPYRGTQTAARIWNLTTRVKNLCRQVRAQRNLEEQTWQGKDRVQIYVKKEGFIS